MPKKTAARKGKTAKPRLTLASVMDCVNETLRKHNMRLKELEQRSKNTDTNWADAVAAAMKAIRNTDRKAASLEALNELRADVLKLQDFNNGNADAIRELRKEVHAMHLGLYGKAPDGRVKFAHSVLARLEKLETVARNHADVFGDRCDRLTTIEDKLGIGVSPIREPATAEERAAMCEKWGPDATVAGYIDLFGTENRDHVKVFLVSGSYEVVKAGLVTKQGTTTTLAELEAVLREHTPKREPDATPEERRAELEARGLKQVKGHSFYSRSGSIGDFPRAWLDGVVTRNVEGPMPTRTMPEFRSALDAVGLVKVEAALVGDGPWGTDALNKAGIACVLTGTDYDAIAFHDAVALAGESKGELANMYYYAPTITRADLLALAELKPTPKEWAAKVRKALGVKE